MKTPRGLFCLLTGHTRSRRRSYVDPLDRKQRSYCRRCETPMLKSWPDGWRAKRPASVCSFHIARLDQPSISTSH